MTTIHPDQIKAAESVMRQYITDPAISAAGAFMEAMAAYLDAAPGRKGKPKADRGEPEGFADFYEKTYPRKVGRRKAAQEYGFALTRSTREIILAGAKRYSEAVKGNEEKYIKHPSTWLHGDHWKDELGQLTLVGGTTVFEDATVSGWVNRLEIFAGKRELPRGSWREAWGPKPAEPDTKVPKEAISQFRQIYPKPEKKSG